MVQRKTPRSHPSGGTKSEAFSTRITKKLRDNLDEAARHSGKSLSDEIEIRLTRSFERDDEIAKLRSAVEQERKRPRVQFGGDQNYEVLAILAEIMKGLRFATGKKWSDDVWTFGQLKAGILHLLHQWQPDGEAKRPPVRHFSQSTAENLGEALASHQLARLEFEDLDNPNEDQTRKRNLGDLATRRHLRDVEVSEAAGGL